MRNTRTVPIKKAPDGAKENRDAGKVFIVTEMAAVPTEEWGLRAMMALGTGGIQVPAELANAGLFGVLLVGYQAFMGAKEEAVLPLWREMLPACVQIQHSPGTKDGAATFEDFKPHHVEEVSTLLLLRQTIMELHTGFTMAELASRFATLNSAAPMQPQNLSTTQGGPLQAA